MGNTALAVKENESRMIVPASQSMFLSAERFEFAQRIGKMLASSTMIPDHFRGNLGNCLIALNLAERMGVDVFMLMQTMHVIHGRPGIEAKLAIALFNEGSKQFETPLRFEKEGDNPKDGSYRCRAYAKDLKTGEVLYGEWIDWELVKAEGWDSKSGSKWKTMPGQMFVYRSAVFFIREYEPGVLLGIRTKDELQDFIDITPEPVKISPVQAQAPAEEGEDPYKTTTMEPEDKTEETGAEEPTPEEYEIIDPDEPLDEKDHWRAQWVNMRSAGYSTFIHKNFARVEENGKKWPDLYDEMKEKWAKLYPDDPWPLVEQADEPTDNVPKTGTMTSGEYMAEIGQYKSMLPAAKIQAVLMIYGDKAESLEKVKPERYEAVLKALKERLDAQNA